MRGVLKASLVLLLAAQPTAFGAESSSALATVQIADQVASLIAQIEEDAAADKKSAAALQLCRLDTSATAFLIEGFRTASEEARPSILRALLSHPNDDVRALLLEELPRAGDECPAYVISALGRLRVREATPALLDLYSAQEDARRRQSILSCLAEMRDVRGLDILAEAIASEDRLERLTSASGLQKLATEGADGRLSEGDTHRVHSRLIALLKADSLSTEARAGIITAFGMTGESDLAHHLHRFVNAPARGTRRRAVQAIGKMKARTSASRLIGALDDKEVSVRVAAIEALEKIEDKECVGGLILLLRDREALVRKRSLRALRRISGETFSSNPEQWERWYDSDEAPSVESTCSSTIEIPRYDESAEDSERAD